MARNREQKKREQARRHLSRPAVKKNAAPPIMSRPRAQETAHAICAEARSTAARFLERDGRARQVTALAGATRDFALRVIQRSPHSGRHECRAGCAFCCHTGVTVAPPEAMTIMNYLREHCTAEELANVRERIESNAETASRMTHLEYTAASIRCALLTDDGNCRVHPVRPLACAGFLSMSRAACEAEFNRAPGRGKVPIDDYARLAGLSASYGLREACQQAGVDGEFYELHHALRRLWDQPDAADAWARGETPLADCLRASAW